MPRQWWTRFSIIIITLLWGAYTLTPTFLADSAEERLAQQAKDAQSPVEKLQKQLDDGLITQEEFDKQMDSLDGKSQVSLQEQVKRRVPDAVDLPIWLQTKMLAEIKDCETSCSEYTNYKMNKDTYEGTFADHEWVLDYYVDDGKKAQRSCAERSLTLRKKDECAVEGLRACASQCAVAEVDEETKTALREQYGKVTVALNDLKQQLGVVEKTMEATPGEDGQTGWSLEWESVPSIPSDSTDKYAVRLVVDMNYLGDLAELEKQLKPSVPQEKSLPDAPTTPPEEPTTPAEETSPSEQKPVPEQNEGQSASDKPAEQSAENTGENQAEKAGENTGDQPAESTKVETAEEDKAEGTDNPEAKPAGEDTPETTKDVASTEKTDEAPENQNATGETGSLIEEKTDPAPVVKAPPTDYALDYLEKAIAGIPGVRVVVDPSLADDKNGTYHILFTDSFGMEKVCADACIGIHNDDTEEDVSWAFNYYNDNTNKEFVSCLERVSEKLREEPNCISALKSACTNACREKGEEKLPFWAKATLATYPNARLNLGLDLQGGIDMDLKVDTDDAIASSIQRDVTSILSQAKEIGLPITDVFRNLDDTGKGQLWVSIGSEGSISKFQLDILKKNFTLQDPTKFKYEEAGTQTQNGVEYYLFNVTDEAQAQIADNAIKQALETLRGRIDETGVKEPSIVLKGGNKINVQLPGMHDVKEAMQSIKTAAVLEFKMVDEVAMNRRRDVQRAVFDAESAPEDELTNKNFKDDEKLARYLKEKHPKLIPKGSTLMWEYKTNLETGKKERVENGFYVVKEKTDIRGDDINDASVGYNQFNEPYVALEFTPKGAAVFQKITGANVGKRFAIILDDEVRSAPVIRSEISGGRASIEMGVQDYQMALNEANVLSLVLRTGALPAKINPGSVRTVGPSLGADAIAAGKTATMVGFAFVLVFMLFRYKVSGIVSVIALVSNVLLVFALLATVEATLTLPGIAGIALTIGMAVDCNIIIYERIREEHNLGKNVRAAVSSGFDKALLAVLDANITTFIAGVVLYTYGTGPIKGFAVTLMIGIITTLFTGVFLSRTLMDFLTRKASSRLSI